MCRRLPGSTAPGLSISALRVDLPLRCLADEGCDRQVEPISPQRRRGRCGSAEKNSCRLSGQFRQELPLIRSGAILSVLYGDRAADAVTREEPSWQAWMNERFPSRGGSE